MANFLIAVMNKNQEKVQEEADSLWQLNRANMIKAIDDEFPDDVLIKEYWYPKSKDAGTASCTSKRFIYLFDKGAVGAARREAVPARPRPARSPCRSPRALSLSLASQAAMVCSSALTLRGRRRSTRTGRHRRTNHRPSSVWGPSTFGLLRGGPAAAVLVLRSKDAREQDPFGPRHSPRTPVGLVAPGGPLLRPVEFLWTRVERRRTSSRSQVLPAVAPRRPPVPRFVPDLLGPVAPRGPMFGPVALR